MNEEPREDLLYRDGPNVYILVGEGSICLFAALGIKH